MTLKIIIALAALSLGFVSPLAHAEGEGNGEPFRFSAPVQASGLPFVTDTGSELYPQPTGRVMQPASLAELAPASGSEAMVQTANSLPQGFFGRLRPRNETALATR